jgi:hypothetical protein
LLPFSAIERIVEDASKSQSLKVKYIYIMSEAASRRNPSQSASKLNTDHQRRRCHVILHKLRDRVASIAPKNSVVMLLRGHDMMDDLLRLLYAKITICSASTYCLWPALAKEAAIKRVNDGSIATPLVTRIPGVPLASYMPVSNLFLKGKTYDYRLSHFKWIQRPSLVYFDPYQPDQKINWGNIQEQLEKSSKDLELL